VGKWWDKWVWRNKKVVIEALNHLKWGTETNKTKHLGALSVSNAKSAVENGRYMPDALAGWIKKGFVAGQFENALLAEF